MNLVRNKAWVRAVLLLAMVACVTNAAHAQGGKSESDAKTVKKERGFVDFLKAGGAVGYAILAMSVVGAALVIDSFRRLKPQQLMPENVVTELDDLARKGRFSQMVTLCRANSSLICRIVGSSLAQGSLGLPAVREAMQENGLKEITKITHRVNYMGFIGAIAPMMGLLGTVIGMIGSFNVLGESKGTARPDELASGIAFALVTTCEGLVLAIPMMFFHNYFRDRVARLGQECSGLCERLLRVLTVVIDTRRTTKTGESTGDLATESQS